MKVFKLILFFMLVGITCAFAQVVQIPSEFDPSNTVSLMEWWQFVYALVTPVGVWVYTKFFPSKERNELIIKASSIAIIVLLIIIFYKGVSVAVVGQAVIAFIMQVVAYDKILRPLGLESGKVNNYTTKK